MSELLYLSRRDVEAVGLRMPEIIELVTFALKQKANGRTEMPPKPSIHPRPGAVLQAMPAWVEGARACGMKWVSAFPENKSRGLPDVGGLIVVNNPETGQAEAIMDAAWITAQRTGAATAAAARVLARPESETGGLLGAGVQARANIIALAHVLPRLGKVRVYSPRAETVNAFRNEMECACGIEIEPAGSPENAVRGADVIVAAAPWPALGGEPPIRPEWISPGVFASALNFDASFGAAASSFDTVLTDDVATMDHYRGPDCFSGWPPASEIAPVVAGLRPGRMRPDERVLAVILGLGIYDVVVARQVVDRARQQGIGDRLET